MSIRLTPVGRCAHQAVFTNETARPMECSAKQDPYYRLVDLDANVVSLKKSTP